MAQFSCPSCYHQQEVADQHTGKKTKCPKCEAQGVVESSSEIQILRESGGSVQTVLTNNVRLNDKSTLEREFITVVDATLPAQLKGCTGVKTRYESGNGHTAGGYQYAASYSIQASEDLRAVEVRFVLFNIWGRYVRTLGSTKIADIPATEVRHYSPKWNLYSENDEAEASEHYASIAFVSTVRTSAGKVLDADMACILEEGKRFSSKFAAADLEPTPLRA